MATERDMADLDAAFDTMDLDDLRQVQKRVKGLIANYHDRKRREAVAAAEEAVQEHGFTLSELLGGKAVRGSKAASRQVPPVKYANPDHPDQTWTGKGRRPAWVHEAVESGRSLEELAV